MDMGWPQWVWILIASLSLASMWVLDGKARQGNYSLAHHMLATAFTAWLLWCGGFFG